MIKGFSLDIYDCDIAFAWDTNEKEINAYFDKAQVPDDYRKGFWENYGEGKVGALTTFSCVFNAFTVFRDEPNNKVVAHEIYHIAYNVLKPRGVEDEEAWAYLIGFLTEMFYDLYLEKDEEEGQEEHYIKANGDTYTAD